MKTLTQFIEQGLWVESQKDAFKNSGDDLWEEFLHAATWKQFGAKEVVIVEDTSAPTNTTDGAAAPDAKPMFTKGKFAGVDCIEVDGETYSRCKFGKKPYSRWSGVVEDEHLRSFIQSHYQKSSRLMVMDAKTGAMTYIKR